MDAESVESVESGESEESVESVEKVEKLPKLVLSIDGGGIRGIIPAMVLQEIEARLETPIREVFDLVVGCSTGSIISAGLCSSNANQTASDVLELFEKEGAKIFEKSTWRSAKCWFYGSMYSSDNFERILDDTYKEDTIADVSCKLMMLTYDINNCMPFFIKSWRSDRNFIKLKDAIRASTAAPTFFCPKPLVVNDISRVLIDGGVFANNPASCGYIAARQLYPNDDIIMLSLGTGLTTVGIKYTEAKEYGKMSWISPLLGILLKSDLENVNYHMRNLLHERYIRVQKRLSVASSALDDTSLKNINNLQKEGLLVIEKCSKEIDDFCEFVSENILLK